MRKLIATVAATALAIAGAVVVAPSASADVRLVPVKGALGFLQVEGAIEEVQMLNELPVDWYGFEFNGVNCQDRLVGKAFPTDTNPADVIRWFRYNRNANDPACDVAFTVVKETTPFPGESWWFGQNFTDSSPERVSYPALPNCAPEATYGDNGEWCFELKYGDTPYLNDRVSTEQPDYTPDYIDECTPPLVEAMADRGLSIKDGVRVSVDFSGIYSGKPFACFVQPQNVIDNSEPQVDADCSADEMVVPTADGNVCFQAPTAVSGGKEDKEFNRIHYDGIVTDEYKLFEYCPSVDYIGNWMKLQNGQSWTDWYRENLALDNLSTSDDLMDCEDRVIDAVDGDQNFLGLSSFTSFSHTEDFFTAPVDGEPLCTIAPLERNNRHDLHCQTTVRFSQVVTTWVDPNQAPPGFEVEWVPDPNKEISIELPAVPDSLDYEFVYEKGEAGCLYDGEEEFVQNGLTFCGTPVDNPVDVEPIQEWNPPPPECWQGPNNCPVGQSISYAVPQYMMVGVPVNVTVRAIRTVEDELGRFNYGQPDNGTAVIHYGDPDSPPVAGVPFENGQATFRVVPQEAGKKNFSICGVLNSGTTGGNAYIECVDGETTVLPYDPEVYRKAFRDLALEKGDKFTIVDRDQAKGKVAERLEWRVAQSDDDVCAVYETKKGKVRAKFSKTGECTVLWTDPKTGDSGKIQIG